jgi:hypothetical protein
MPKAAGSWSLTSLREKLIKIGAKVVSHGRYVTFQMAEVVVPRHMFAEILILNCAAAEAACASMRGAGSDDATADNGKVRLDSSKAAFQRLAAVNWRFRPPLAPHGARFAVAQMPKRDVLASQRPGIRGMSVGIEAPNAR